MNDIIHTSSSSPYLLAPIWLTLTEEATVNHIHHQFLAQAASHKSIFYCDGVDVFLGKNDDDGGQNDT